MKRDINIQNELIGLKSLLSDIPFCNVYAVPEGYFENFLPDLLNILDTKNADPVAAATVPDGYFEGLAGNILAKIKESELQNDPTLSFDARQLETFRVPAGYFDSLADNLLHQIRPTDIESKVLPVGLHKINVYEAPAGYFESLAGQVVARLPVQGRVISMRRSISRYAVAAVLSGIIGLSVISVFNKKDIPATENTPATMQLADNILKTRNFDEVLATVSANDIIQYLQRSGEDVNAALVASVADDKNLPEQIDYLADDKTLDKLLDGLTLKTSETN